MGFPFEDLPPGVDGLTVIVKNDSSFREALTSRSFIANFPSEDLSGEQSLFPDAIFVATTTSAVQKAIIFCCQHKIRVSVRTGGHNWHTIFLQGENTIILDVGGMNDVAFDQATRTVVAGPGATSVNTKIPKEYFFPSGHCPTVPLGGFILGGGYGIGFTKYGMACSLVTGMEVVLASGETRWVRDTDTDEVAKSLMALGKGSYHRFPAVVTKYQLRVVPAPKCVLPQSFLFETKDWKLAVRHGRDIAHRCATDTSCIEISVVFCHCPPDLVRDTGMKTMVVLSLMVWSDNDETTTRCFLESFTEQIDGTVIPSTRNKPLNANTVAEDVFGPKYPDARYVTDGFFGDESFFESTDETYFDLMQPLADSWMSDDNVLPGPHSHTLFVLCNKTMRQVNGCDLACGFVPSFEVMSYGIFDDNSAEQTVFEKLKEGLLMFEQSECTWTVLPEGNIRTGKAAFRKESWDDLSKKLRRVDPNGIFKKT